MSRRHTIRWCWWCLPNQNPNPNPCVRAYTQLIFHVSLHCPFPLLLLPALPIPTTSITCIGLAHCTCIGCIGLAFCSCIGCIISIALLLIPCLCSILSLFTHSSNIQSLGMCYYHSILILLDLSSLLPSSSPFSLSVCSKSITCGGGLLSPSSLNCKECL